MAPILEVSTLSKYFPGMPAAALADVEFSMDKGSFTTLIGPSGCGKTTLLRIVGGLAYADKGKVLIDGVLSEGPSREKAMVFQHFNLLPWRTALNNVAYGLELQGISKAERISKAKEYLELVGLSAFEDHYPSELSGGMQQRVGIARALIMEPKLLLMDEPFGALDALTREDLQTELQRICTTTDASVLFVTHSIDEAIYLSDDVIVMGTHPGRIISRYKVELPRPRWTYNVREDERFSHLRTQLWEELASEIRSTSRSTVQRMSE